MGGGQTDIHTDTHTDTHSDRQTHQYQDSAWLSEKHCDAILIGTNFRVFRHGLPKLIGSRHDSLCGMDPDGIV